jgi:phospholipid/cholesterol/gamma-HCH transport system substrate-binding protein
MASQKRVSWAQLRVGIVATIAMVIAGALIFLLTSQSNMVTGEFELRTFMEDSAGMAENAPVRLNGIFVGHIRKVQLSGSHDPHRTVEILMRISRKYFDLIPDDSRAAISAANLLGDKYINITKGTHPKHVAEGGELQAVETQDIPELLAQATGLLAQFKGILGRVDGMLAVVDKGEGNLGKLLHDDALYDRFNATLGEIQQLVKDVKNSNGTISKVLYSDELYTDIRRLLQRADDMLAHVQQGKGTAAKLLYDPAIADETRATIGEAKKMLENLNAGKGTAGKLLTEDQIAKQLTEIATKLNTAIDKINSGQGTIGQLMVNRELFDGANSVTKELNSLLVDVHKNPKKFVSIRLTLF